MNILLVFYFLLKKYITENLNVFLYLSVVLVGKNFKLKKNHNMQHRQNQKLVNNYFGLLLK